MAGKKQAEAGFTLVEVMTAVVVTGILYLAAAPAVQGALESFRVSSAADKMMNDIRYARELALNRHGTFGVGIDTNANAYEIFELSGTTKTTISSPHRQTSFSVDFDDHFEFAGVAITSADVCDGMGCPSVDLRFDAFGRPRDSNGNLMSQPALIALTAGSTTRTLRVFHETGYSELI